MDNRVKVYVDVNADHLQDGQCVPKSIRFKNGKIYEIDRVKKKCRASSTKAGGTGMRYTVRICGVETFLFDELNGRWFVEGKV